MQYIVLLSLLTKYSRLEAYRLREEEKITFARVDPEIEVKRNKNRYLSL